jgi:hypothetical protein
MVTVRGIAGLMGCAILLILQHLLRHEAIGQDSRFDRKRGLSGSADEGIKYYLENLFAEDGLSKPFSKAPHLTVYQRELYDCAECINLCLLLRDRFPRLETVVAGILRDWIKPDGSFKSRRLHLGWDNVPMHRWGQAQMFRSLGFYACEYKVSAAMQGQRISPLQRG